MRDSQKTSLELDRRLTILEKLSETLGEELDLMSREMSDTMSLIEENMNSTPQSLQGVIDNSPRWGELITAKEASICRLCQQGKYTRMISTSNRPTETFVCLSDHDKIGAQSIVITCTTFKARPKGDEHI